jgi:hypothetical protein
MRYGITYYEWTAIESALPNKPRGVPRVRANHALHAACRNKSAIAEALGDNDKPPGVWFRSSRCYSAAARSVDSSLSAATMQSRPAALAR